MTTRSSSAKPRSKKREAKGKTEVSAYQQRQAEKTNSAIDDLLPRVNNKTVGVGSYAGFIRGTEAKDFAADLEFLKSSIGFGALQEMRRASKTGGALGQVSDRELSLLTSALGGLDVGQTPENFKKNLNRIKKASIGGIKQLAGQAILTKRRRATPIIFPTKTMAAPTREQLISNIQALEKQGAPQADIQSYLNSFKGMRPPTKEVPVTATPEAPKRSLIGRAAEFLAPTATKTVEDCER